MINMTEEKPSCANCKYATIHIPYYTYPWSDPYCAKGKGKCKVGKRCIYYEQIGRLSR